MALFQFPWQKSSEPTPEIPTDQEHAVEIQREAIPLVFVPGIMGSRLRRAGSDGEGNGPDGLPNLRWNPSAHWFREAGTVKWMFDNYKGASGEHRRGMLIGPSGTPFSPGYLEVDNGTPYGDGWQGIMVDYCDFLKVLRKQKWGPLAKIFEFPVYAFGYNWTDNAESAGEKLAERIRLIIDEARGVTGSCEKVIILTHSMGGLVARSCSELSNAQSLILGVIHGVQPASGAAAGYWRMKGGFESRDTSASILGDSALTVTPVLGNSPGGLQLLPSQSYCTNASSRQWLIITEDGKSEPVLALPQNDPYTEIYSVPAQIVPKAGEHPSTNTYWGLVDPDLLDPGAVTLKFDESVPMSSSPDDNDALMCKVPPSHAWFDYLDNLEIARKFHAQLGRLKHPVTFSFRGNQHDTASMVELRIQPRSNNLQYPVGGFRGHLTGTDGSEKEAEMRDSGHGGSDEDETILTGDGTVPVSSSIWIIDSGAPPPGNREFNIQHQPAYEDSSVQKYAIQAIIAIAQKRYDDKMHAAPAVSEPSEGQPSSPGQ
jgi:hypothetical protein